MAMETKTYSSGVDFGRYTFAATTADYINKLFGTNISNSYEYDSGNDFIYTKSYSSRNESFGPD